MMKRELQKELNEMVVSENFLENIKELKSLGMTEKEIAKALFGEEGTVYMLRYLKSKVLRERKEK